MDVRDDITLLTLIAQKRDHAAFAEFHERYQARAYNMAYRILRDATLAQDAVQEALVAIWRAPQAPAGSAEDWIFKIVINKSISLKTSQQRRARREEAVAERLDRPHSAPEVRMEDKELITRLRAQIDQLPELERYVLACSSCTSMSQQEIAKLVGVSQKTVSNKIQQILDRLRTALSGAGVAAVAPLLDRENIIAAMTTGHECPPGLTELTLRRIKSAERVSRALRAPVAARGAVWAPLAGGALLLMLAAGTFLWTRSQTTPAAAVGAGGIPAVAPAPSSPVSRSWNFDTPEQAQGIQVVRGSWQWVPQGGPDHSGCMETGEGGLDCALDVDGMPLPLTVTFQLYHGNNGIKFNLCWEKDEGIVRFRSKDELPTPPSTGTWIDITPPLYVMDQAIVFDVNQKTIVNLERRKDRARLLLTLHGPHDSHVRIDNLKIESIPLDKVPDVAPYVEALERIPAAARHDTVMLDGDDAPAAGKCYTAEFFPANNASDASPGREPGK